MLLMLNLVVRKETASL